MFDKVELKVATLKDLNFLYNLKKKTLKQYLNKLWGWDKNFQRKNFLKHFNSNRISIILFATKKIGCLILRKSQHWIIIELIALKPKFQCKGIGTFIIKTIILQSQQENKPIFLQVLKVNKRAIKLYLKLGFLQTSETENSFNMQYKRN